MSNKEKALRNAVFYAHEKPELLAGILKSAVSDVAVRVEVQGATSIDLDTTKGSTSTYTGVALSQFGDTMPDSVTLSLKESVTGVSISSGTVTVAKTVTDGTTFVVVGTLGTITGELEVTVNVAEGA